MTINIIKARLNMNRTILSERQLSFLIKLSLLMYILKLLFLLIIRQLIFQNLIFFRVYHGKELIPIRSQATVQWQLSKKFSQYAIIFRICSPDSMIENACVKLNVGNDISSNQNEIIFDKSLLVNIPHYITDASKIIRNKMMMMTYLLQSVKDLK